jgi:hypothetical protein
MAGGVATFYLGWLLLGLLIHPDRASFAAVLLVSLAVLATMWMALYRLRAKVVVTGERVTQVGLFRTKSFPTSSITSLAMCARAAPTSDSLPLLILGDDSTQGRLALGCLFRDVWDDKDISALIGALGRPTDAELSRNLSTAELNSAYAGGGLPTYLVHPMQWELGAFGLLLVVIGLGVVAYVSR